MNKLKQSCDCIDVVEEYVLEQIKNDISSINEKGISEYFNFIFGECHSLQDYLKATILNSLNGVSSYERRLIDHFLSDDNITSGIMDDICTDLMSYYYRDPACVNLIKPFVFYKGFHAFVLYRVSHILWNTDREYNAYILQAVASRVYAVDIHPAAKIGAGIMLDHATGLVVGETTVIEDDVSIMQGVTLGGNGKEETDRHPKIGKGVLLSVDCKVLGNIRVGEGVKVGAGSIVLKDVPPHVTVAGIPAKVVGKPKDKFPGESMNHMIEGNKSIELSKPKGRDEL